MIMFIKKNTIMDVKTLRKRHLYPLNVLKRALELAGDNNHAINAAVEIAVEEYAAVMRKRPATIKVYGAACLSGKLAIVELLTETMLTAQSARLQQFANQLAEKAVRDGEEIVRQINFDATIAESGEHIKLDSVCVMDFSSDIMGYYNHKGRFLCFAVLTGAPFNAQSEEATEIAEYIARNAMHYYADYLRKCPKIRLPKMPKCTEATMFAEPEKYLQELTPQFPDFLLKQRLLLNYELDSFPWSKFLSQTQIGTYLNESSKQLSDTLLIPDIALKIKKLGLFGKFDS